MSRHDTAGSRFDAPRPVVTFRLGTKRTEELIRADGDTWQEYLAVSVKPEPAKAPKRGGPLSIFGKKNKNKQKSESTSTKSNGNDSKNLIIRSYYQNKRTKKKVWDEPPSGASKIIPASEEMRRMAEFQLGELYVSTDLGERSFSSSDSVKKKSSTGGRFWLSNTSSTGSASSLTIGESLSFKRNAEQKKRIRYKPNSILNSAKEISARDGTDKSRQDSNKLNDRHLKEAIERSMADTSGRDQKATVESEDEILRRVLEESRLEALSLGNLQSNGDCKLSALKSAPTNTA